MFKKFTLSPTQTELFDEHSFFKAFSNDLKRAKRSVLIESPYITVRRAKEFSALMSKCRRNLKVTILTRNPNHHNGNLIIQSIKGMEILRSSGAEVVVCDDLRHRKFAIIDDGILWEGSLDMLSHSNSKEIMRRDVSTTLCKQLINITSIDEDLGCYN
jgi:hypothetical protein